MKRIVTMQDISGIGKCSLTAALPVISAMGVETAVLPTAVLSTHTMFSNVVFHDLTPEIHPIIAHWKAQNFAFDAVYTGYLGSIEQLDLARELIETFPAKEFVLVDPCMADNGKLYHGFTPEFVKEMRGLCSHADVICPNLTEAVFLLDEEYPGDNYSEEYIRELLKRLSSLGAPITVLTGISFNDHELGVYGYDRRKDEWFSFFTEKQPQSFHGTGDLWASVFSGAMLNGLDFKASLKLASEFVCECIRLTLAEENHNVYGTNFEQAIPYLIDSLRTAKAAG